ncbi:hypothetical protein NicSoilE8_05270 [Arthrobacter sp. NicSoilE8]|nr:hypothetical protein NicSoilE8_05270 [Arthrobacter sp. NicSoilE8]
MIDQAAPPLSTTATVETKVSRIIQHSISLILQQQSPTGAYPASPDFSAYAGYCWFRDGAYIADAMSSAGQVDSAERFFDWCSKSLTTRSDSIRRIIAETKAGRPPANEDMLATRFTLDGADGDDEWWDFQLDGYGTWLWALAEHHGRHNRPLDAWTEAIQLTVDYLLCSWKRPCYDWWEEFSEHVHVSTLGCIAAGLESIAETGHLSEATSKEASLTSGQIRRLIASRGTHKQHLTKWLGSETVDGSLSALIAPMNFIDPHSALAKSTIEAVEKQLTVNNGVHRYLDDTYYGGGQWPLLSCFLGLAHAATGNRTRAKEMLQWAASTASDDADFPEQVEDHLLSPDHLQLWIERWGTSANPLLWSHAMFLRLAIALGAPSPDVTAPHSL